MAPQAIVISPGPCTPAQAGISVELVRSLVRLDSDLGVCLGHQAIGEALGGKVVRRPYPCMARVRSSGTSRLRSLPDSPIPFQRPATIRFALSNRHSPPELRVTARTEDGVVMAIEHRTRPLFGVQFHPESVLTESGHRLLANFLTLAGISAGDPPPGDYRPPTTQASSSRGRRMACRFIGDRVRAVRFDAGKFEEFAELLAEARIRAALVERLPDPRRWLENRRRPADQFGQSGVILAVDEPVGCQSPDRLALRLATFGKSGRRHVRPSST